MCDASLQCICEENVARLAIHIRLTGVIGPPLPVEVESVIGSQSAVKGGGGGDTDEVERLLIADGAGCELDSSSRSFGSWSTL